MSSVILIQLQKLLNTKVGKMGNNPKIHKIFPQSFIEADIGCLILQKNVSYDIK